MTRAAGGLALLELVAAAALGGVVAAGAISLLAAQGRLARRTQAALERIDEARWALAVMTRDIELAGADPSRAGVGGVVAARAERVVLASDRDGDGQIDAASRERIEIAPSAGGGSRLIRAVGRQRMALLSGLRRVRFRFFGASGEEIRGGGAGGGLGAGALGSVRWIELDLEARDALGRVVRLRGGAAIRRRLGPRPAP